MNTLRKNILIGLTVLGMGSVGLVQAQDQSPAPAPEGRQAHAVSQEQRQANRTEHFAKRQAKLHDALKLTAAQEPAWNTYQAAIKQAPMAMQGDRAAWAGLSAPARMEKMIALSKQHTAAMESHLAALNTFYAVLTPEQKKVFDAQTKGGHHGAQRSGDHTKGMQH